MRPDDYLSDACKCDFCGYKSMPPSSEPCVSCRYTHLIEFLNTNYPDGKDKLQTLFKYYNPENKLRIGNNFVLKYLYYTPFKPSRFDINKCAELALRLTDMENELALLLQENKELNVRLTEIEQEAKSYHELCFKLERLKCKNE